LTSTGIQKIDTMLFSYLWDGKPAKIKRNTIIAKIEEGGLKMIDTESMHRAAKIGWIKRWFKTDESNGKSLSWKMINIQKYLFSKNLNYNISKFCKSYFHKQVVESWITLYCTEPMTGEEILNQYLLFNRFICIENKYISREYLGSNFSNINIKLKDIINNEGKILNIY